MPKRNSANITACNALLTNEHTISLWHQRLGHCPLSVINHISSLKSSSHSISPCDVCQFSKQSRIPFPISTTCATNILELLHMDLWGPYKIPSLNNAHYVLTIVDDKSRVTWTFLLTYKSQVANRLINFIIQAQKQYKKSVKFVRTDNGTEFVNHHCHTFFTQSGIIHQTSCEYTPNRMVQLSASINISQPQHVAYSFNHIFLPNFGVNLFSLPPT